MMNEGSDDIYDQQVELVSMCEINAHSIFRLYKTLNRCKAKNTTPTIRRMYSKFILDPILI